MPQWVRSSGGVRITESATLASVRGAAGARVAAGAHAVTIRERSSSRFMESSPRGGLSRSSARSAARRMRRPSGISWGDAWWRHPRLRGRIMTAEGSHAQTVRGAGDMDPEAFRRFGHRLIDWVADYLKDPEQYPVLARIRPGELVRALPAEPPGAAAPSQTVLDDFQRLIPPATTNWNHPGFFAYFAITGSGPGILGELLAAALNVNAMVWRSGPSATELEQVTLDWLRQMMGLPPSFIGTI